MNFTPTAIAGNVKLRPWSSVRKLSFRSLTLGLTIGVVSYLVLVPLFMLLYASLKSTEDKLPFESTVITLSNYAVVLTSPATLPIFLNTMLFTVGSLAVGLPLGIAMTRRLSTWYRRPSTGTKMACGQSAAAVRRGMADRTPNLRAS